MSDHNLRKSLKKPDQFQKIVVNILEWIGDNQLPLLMVLGAVLLSFGAVLGWQHWKALEVDRRQDELSVIQEIFNGEQKIADKKREEVTAELEKLRAPKKEGDKTPALSPSEQEAASKTLQKKYMAIEADHSKSAEKFLDFYRKYPNDPEGWYAGMHAVQNSIAKKDFAGAREILEKIVAASGSKSDFYRIYSRTVLVNVLTELKDFDAAVREANTLIGEKSEDLKPQNILLKAQTLIAKGDKAEAAKALDELISGHASSTEASKAKSLKALLVR